MEERPERELIIIDPYGEEPVDDDNDFEAESSSGSNYNSGSDYDM